MKKLLIGLVILIALLSGGGYYWYTQQTPSVVSEPVEAIPKDAILVFRYPDIRSFWDTFEEQDYYESVFSIKELNRYFRRNLLLDSIIRYDPELKTLLGNSEIWSSYHLSDTDSLSVLYAFQPERNDIQLLSKLNNAFKGSGIVSSIKFGERDGIKLVVSDPFFSMYITLANGLVLAAGSESLLNQSLKQLGNETGLLDNEAFANASSAAGKNVEVNVFVNYQSLPKYLKRMLKPTTLYTEDVVSQFASWSEVDLSMKPNGLTLNGFTYTTDSLQQFLDLFLDQKPRSIDFPNYIPSNTASFIFYGIDDLISFTADYRNLLSSQGRLESLEATLDSVNKLHQIDIEQNILAWMGTSYGVCITEPKSASFAEQTYWVFEARSSELANKLLYDLGETLAKETGSAPFVGGFNGVKIGQLKLQGILSELFGDGYDDFSNPYFMVLEDFVVFASTERSLVEYLQYIQADRTLAKELSFSRFIENLSSSYNVFTYHHLGRSKNILNSYLNRDAVDVLERNNAAISQFEALGTQITTTGQSFYSNVFLNYNPDWQESVESFWKAPMDAEAQTTPVFVTNHLSKKHEILVQDKNNQLYLFNLVGQELFKRELPEPIESEPIQVDAFKNGKLQYIFNTKNYIYLIDRNGNDVDGFPIELDSPAETDLSVIEYDGKRDYRLLITCKNKKIYNFDIKGKKTKGWRHNKASDPTIQPFKHMFVGKKDYLITGESNGKIHLLDRRGKNRVKVKKRVSASKNNQLQTFKSSKRAFDGVYITDEDGLIYRVSLNGEVQSMNLGKFSTEHHFLFADLNQDGTPEFIFYDLNMLQVFDYKKQKVFEQRIAPSATLPTLHKLANGEFGIGFHYSDGEQLVLFDAKGNMVQGFPLSGNSAFSLLHNNGSSVVVSKGSSSDLIIQPIQ